MAATRKIAQMMSAAVAGVFTLAPALTVTMTVGMTPSPVMAQTQGKDTIIFRSGKVVEGRILKETATHYQVEVDVAGIKAITDYAKSDVLSVTRAEAAEGGEAAAPATGATGAKVEPERTQQPASTGAKVYVINLEGTFGQEISETPLKQAVMDAKRHEVDYIIVVVNNDWSYKNEGGIGAMIEKGDEEGRFDELFRAEKMAPVFTEEASRWDKPPKVVFWVKKAMGGAAFLPLISPDIYFSSEGKMGGIGHLTRMLGSMGSESVRQKQYSLRLAHARGMAIRGGHPGELIHAMAETEYVMSYRLVGGRPELLPRYPENSDEYLLTDDGEDEREDTIEELARGEGNDCLTLNADVAYKLGVSKGTVDSLEDLIHQLGIARSHQIVKGQSERIMKNWRDGIENAKRELVRLAEEYGQVPTGGGDYQERTQNRGRRKSLINSMQSLMKRYEEAINPNQLGIPSYNDLEIIKRQIELEQLADRR